MASSSNTGTANDTRPSPSSRDPYEPPISGRHRYVRGETGSQHHAPYVVKVNQPVAGAVLRPRRAERLNGSEQLMARVYGGAS